MRSKNEFNKYGWCRGIISISATCRGKIRTRIILIRQRPWISPMHQDECQPGEHKSKHGAIMQRLVFIQPAMPCRTPTCTNIHNNIVTKGKGHINCHKPENKLGRSIPFTFHPQPTPPILRRGELLYDLCAFLPFGKMRSAVLIHGLGEEGCYMRFLLFNG